MTSTLRFAALLVACLPSVCSADSAEQILEATGVTGGLVVHLGCGDGKLTAALGAGSGYLVHGLDADPANVARARVYVDGAGLYGKVSVDTLRGSVLPYASDLVNLVVSEDPGDVPMSEVSRVLCPGGVAYIKSGAAWEKTVKPRPKELDEWTHFLHGPDNNAVSHDTAVDLPRGIQWLGKPTFARAHEQLASLSACVTSGGRLFYIIDDTPRADIRFQSKWSLVARDAFNGVVLWQRAIPTWMDQFRRFRAGPAGTTFRLVAKDDRVYVTLGVDAPVSILDAVTGKTLATCEGTDNARQILRIDDKLAVLVDTGSQISKEQDAQIRRGLKPATGTRFVVVADAASGKTLWRKEIGFFVHPTLTAQGDRLFYQTQKNLFCVYIATGKPLWNVGIQMQLTSHEAGWESPTLTVYDAAVYCADFKKIVAYGVDDGGVLWTGKSQAGYNFPPDLFITGGLLWMKGNGMVGMDPATGEVRRQIKTIGGYMHHRCYRNKATDRFFLRGDLGVQYVDIESGEARLHHWIRGTCQYGIMPANGLLYITPDSCACNMKTKLSGLWALTSEARGRSKSTGEPEARLEKGGAYGKIDAKETSPAAGDSPSWPVYRHDFARSGKTTASVSASLKPAWRAQVGGRLSGVTAEDGKVFVASVDKHEVVALSEQSGEKVWSFTAGGRVDSPPTIYRGMALFGSADGSVYALRADDGELVWRFRAAPEDRRTFVNGQLESVWPVHGTVLVQKDKVVVAAGRSSYLDGGIRVYHLDPATGKLLSETVVYSPDPETGKQPGNAGKDVRGLLSDILLADGEDVYMRHVKLDFETGDETGTGTHLFSPIGLLDDSWWHRGYWVMSDQFIAHWSGWWKIGNVVPSGRIMSYDATSIFGYGRDKYPGGNTGQWRGGEKYRIFACDRSVPPAKTNRWTGQVPFYVRAMLVAGETMFIAGPPELTKNKGTGESALVLARPEDAVAAWNGEKGGHLWAVSTKDGAALAKYELDVPPVFDGMAAADGRLYLSLQDGSLVCYGQ